MENNTESGFRILSLILLDSSFKREATVTFDPNVTENNLDIELNVQVGVEPGVTVIETVNYTQKAGENIEVSARITMVGVFEKIGDQEFDREQFGQINGAAIIFPYIREHLSSLSLKAGLNPILLPPANFTKAINK